MLDTPSISSPFVGADENVEGCRVKSAGSSFNWNKSVCDSFGDLPFMCWIASGDCQIRTIMSSLQLANMRREETGFHATLLTAS